VLWAKGYGFLIDYLKEQKAEADLSGRPRIQVDVYGGGEDLCDVQRAAQDAELALEFHPAVDHASHALREYKVFINPSKSEVLSTATAEALAMGKYVVIQVGRPLALLSSFAGTAQPEPLARCSSSR